VRARSVQDGRGFDRRILRDQTASIRGSSAPGVTAPVRIRMLARCELDPTRRRKPFARRVHVRAAIVALARLRHGRDAWPQHHPIPFWTESLGPDVGPSSSTPGTSIANADILLPAIGEPAFGPSPHPQKLHRGGQLGLARRPPFIAHARGIPRSNGTNQTMG